MTKNTLKRFECRMNDGEYCCSFNTLEEAKQYRSKNNFCFISRYIIIYDNFEHKRIL